MFFEFFYIGNPILGVTVLDPFQEVTHGSSCYQTPNKLVEAINSTLFTSNHNVKDIFLSLGNIF